jgi:hypothetical protein
MKVGDVIVNGAGLRRQVISYVRPTKTVRCSDEDGRVFTIPDGDSDWTVLWNPAATWPFVNVPIGRGRVERIIYNNRLLTRFLEWTTPDVSARGGPIYLHSNLALRPHDTIRVFYLGYPNGTRVKIPRGFGTMTQRVKRAEEVPREPRTAFDHILEDDDD